MDMVSNVLFAFMAFLLLVYCVLPFTMWVIENIIKMYRKFCEALNNKE